MNRYRAGRTACALLKDYKKLFKREEKKMSNYQRRKNEIRDKAIFWQIEASETSMSYSELAEAADYFFTVGKRYGLLREFRENGIPC